MKQIIVSVLENNMKQIIALVFLDILSYTIGNIFVVFLNLIIITARVIFKFNNYNCKGIEASA